MFVSPEVYVFLIILGALAFWPIWWLTSKFVHRTRNIFLVSILGSLVATPFLYVAIIYAMLFSMYYYPSRTFTVEAWQATGWREQHGDTVPPTRFEYSGDLIERKLLIGKTKEEVVAMLGEGQEENDRISYDLGFVPGHGIDPEFLEVYFENGVVVKVEQRRS